MSVESTQFVPGERLLDLRQVQQRVPKSTATIYRWMRSGRFPRSIQIGPNSVVWRESDIDAFIAACAAKAG
ncbi:MAG: hypothetical protein BGP16_05340 [Sphingobium sp. 66-54]|nr:MAG: hypothetical protein BGP16_05340 [Sphingobium sp. 66-54]